MSETLVGRCPLRGCEIYSDAAQTPPTLRFTCLDPGRADGVFAVALGLAPMRIVHPSGVTPDRPGGLPGTLEAVTGFIPLQTAALLPDAAGALTAAATPVATTPPITAAPSLAVPTP